MKVSLIITTYNWPAALAVVLDSVQRQTYAAFEIIIADDGSSSDTANVIRQRLTDASMPWRHLRHGDNGIRQARIKNLAVSHATGEYLIFVDHDVVLHPRFIEDHVRFSDNGCFLQGKRVFLSAERTQACLSEGKLQRPTFLTRGLENRKNSVRIPGLVNWINPRKRHQTSLRGCNLSMHRDAFLAVDGYDETFDGLWGREDSDICYRLFHSGWRIKNLWLAGVQYHLHHPSIKRRKRDRLDDELDGILQEKRVRAIVGYSRLSTEGQIIASND